ncbi:hypothetical protein BDZ91DRAFT_52380 [Kalaharituber pfeilii]|nr:hypothetical protein BDZ91DRAFT_52380 [Kalaharituber pfeilii]
MAEVATYHSYQQQASIPPPIPVRKPRPVSVMMMMMMNNPRYVPPEHQQLQQTTQQTHYTAFNQYGSDSLHPNHTCRQQVSASSAGSFSTYPLQRDLPSINTNVNPHDQFAHCLGSTSSTGSPYPQHHHSVPSNPQQDAYVATLRKQKATVWCERAQMEDPRMIAAQRAAKVRATMEVTGASYLQDIGAHGGSSSNSPASSLYGGVSGHTTSPSFTLSSARPSKLVAASGVNTVKKKAWVKSNGGSGHGSSKQIVMDPGSLIVGAVPTRLSASEVMGDSSEEDEYGGEGGTRRSRRAPRTSFNSNHRHSSREYERSRRNSDSLRHMNSTGSKSSAGSSAYSPARSIAEHPAEELAAVPNSDALSPRNAPRHMPGNSTAEHGQQQHYFIKGPIPSRKSTSGSTSTSSSGSVIEGLGLLPPSSALEKMKNSTSDLRRSGSVDEREARTRTMSGVRLFVANPDTN